MTLENMILAVNSFIDAKPWEKIPNGGALIFGVEESDGVLGYAIVTGRENGYALALCRGEQALAGYAALTEARGRNADELEQISLLLDQDCVEYRVEPDQREALEKWLSVFGMEADPWPDDVPKVVSYRPGMIPQVPNARDQQALTGALLAAADYVKNPAAGRVWEAAAKEQGMAPCARPDGKGGYSWGKINLAVGMRIPFPSPALDDELAVRRLRRLPLSGSEVRCAVCRLPMPMDDEGQRVPTVMLLIDDQYGVAAAPMVGDYQRDYGEFAREYVAYVEANGRPKRILATDPRTFCLLSSLAGQMSTPIQRAGSMPEIDHALNGLMEYLKMQVEAARGNEQAAPEAEENPAKDQKGLGAILYEGFEGTMEEVEAHLLEDPGNPEGEENLLIRITYPEDPDFWLFAAVKADAALRHIDNFIRKEWVECCGHASIFHIGETDYTSNTRILPGRSMNAKAADALQKGVPADYEYDIGTPTELQVTVIGTIRLTERREKVLYLAQNYMPKYRCVRCGRRAELVARPDGGPIAESVICARCSREETEIGRYLPLLNSPRTGVCGYGMWFDDEDDE